MSRLQGLGVKKNGMRLNQALVDPAKNIKLSNMRPDVQGYDRSTNTIHILEVAVSQSKKAARDKWSDLEGDLRGRGYRVIVHVIGKEDAHLFGL